MNSKLKRGQSKLGSK